METPNPTRRVVTRSQTKGAAAAASNRGNRFISASGSDDDDDRSIKSVSSRKSRSALFDISNDSPVLGLAMGSLKKSGGRGQPRLRTPGSGESLLRDQVKILLKKVEEEEEDQQQYLGHFLGFNGPGDGGGLLAPPTPPG